MATAGKVAPTPKDKFINGEPYEKLDVVEYNGNLYIAKKASSGVLPTDTEYWMLAVDLSGKLDTTGDTENNTVTFESGDETEPTEWKSVNVLASKEKHSSLFAKISTMFSNVRYLYKLLGTTDISALGSVTEAIATISGNVGNMKGISSSAAITTEGEYALDAREKNASVEGTLANQIDVLNSNFDTKAGKDQISNPNLLCNGWFNVNSRGKTTYTGKCFTLDRWSVTYGGIVEVYDGYITRKGSWALYQEIEYLKAGKYTLSLIIKNIRDTPVDNPNIRFVARLAGYQVNPQLLTDFSADEWQLITYAFNIPEDKYACLLTILDPLSGDTFTVDIKAVKLEAGEISTIHMDNAPNVEEERIRCMLSKYTSSLSDTYANKGAYTEDLWNSTKTYAVGEYCIHNGILWKCLVENSNTAPVEGTTWTATSIGAELASIISKIN